MFWRNKSGFSLVAALVSAAILGILATVFAQLISGAQKGQVGVQNSTDFSILRSSIMLVIEDADLCATAFRSANNSNATVFMNSGTLPGPLRPVGLIRLGSTPNAPVVAKSGQSLGGGLYISSLGLRQVAARAALPGGKYLYRVQLIIEATKKTGGYGAQKLNNNSNPFLLTIQTGAGNRIEKCGVGDTGLSACELRTQSRTIDYKPVAGNSFRLNANREVIGDGTTTSDAVPLVSSPGTRCTKWIPTSTMWDSSEHIAETRTCVVCP